MNALFLILAILGVVAHLLTKYYDAITVGRKEDFLWSRSIVYAAIASIIVTVCILSWEQISQIPPFDTFGKLTNLTSFLLGYFSDSIVKNITKFNPFKE